MSIKEKIDVLKSIFDEILAIAHRGKIFDAEKVEKLQIAILDIHQDYLIMLNDFESDVETIIYDQMGDNSRSEELEKAKRRFYKSSKKMLAARWITKMDADGLLQGLEDPNATTYLLSVIWYFHYHDNIGYARFSSYFADRWASKLRNHQKQNQHQRIIDGEWDSASTFLWLKIEGESDPDTILEKIRNARWSISERYANIVKYHTIFARNTKALKNHKKEK